MPRPAGQGRPRLLVIDDYRPGAEAITSELSLCGYDARFVLDGATALQALAAWVPDIVLLDIETPGMDGYSVAGHLRRDTRMQRVVIVAFTAQDESATRTRGSAAGFDAYCQKGAAPGTLLRLLEQVSG